MRIALALVGLAVATASANASHCRKLSQALAETDRLINQANRLESRNEMEKACAAYGKVVKAKQRILKTTPADCFHGTKKQFEFSLHASKALEELTCTWDKDFLELDD